MTEDQKPPTDQSMEEILSSIRKMVNDGPESAALAVPPSANSREEDVLELTSMVQEDGSIVDLNQMATKGPSPMTAPQPNLEPQAAGKSSVKPQEAVKINEEKRDVMEKETRAAENLISKGAAEEVAASLGQLAQRARKASAMDSDLGSQTLSHVMLEALRPMLKEWLDENLPTLVERLVAKEIEKLVHQTTD